MARELIGQTVLDRYVVEEELGRGAMGSVYRGRHTRLERNVAIKVMHDHLAGEPMLLERFRREAQAAGKLDHANVVPVLDVGELADGKQVMEYAKGRPLAELMTGPLPAERAVFLLRPSAWITAPISTRSALHEMLAGKTPIDGTAMEVALHKIDHDPPPIPQRAPGVVVDRVLDAYMRRLLARDREQRFASAHQALELLELYARDRLAAATALGVIDIALALAVISLPEPPR